MRSSAGRSKKQGQKPRLVDHAVGVSEGKAERQGLKLSTGTAAHQGRASYATDWNSGELCLDTTGQHSAGRS